MYNITLISTHHGELGNCNSDELYKIIESISPEVIFFELSPDLFDRVNNENQISDELPELKAIKRYSLEHNSKNIPVDIDPSQNPSTRDINYMFGTFNKYSVYKKLEDEQYKMTERDGFTFLNSKRCMKLFEEKEIIERNIIEFAMNKNQLFNIYKLFYEEQEKRENKMLQNIYDYGEEHSFDKAIFTVGAGHRKSLLQKIQDYERKEEFKLNWMFYDDRTQENNY